MDSQNRSLSQSKKQASKIWQKGTEYAVSFRQYVLHGHGMRNRIQKRVATLSFTWTSYKPLGSSHNKWLESVNSCESWSRQDEGQPQISIADCINCDTHWFRPSPDEHQPTDGFRKQKTHNSKAPNTNDLNILHQTYYTDVSISQLKTGDLRATNEKARECGRETTQRLITLFPS
jgi:hypothetical protein